MKEEKKRITSRTVRQCYYCQNYFVKNEESVQKHLSICAAKEEITYSFNNSQVTDYQDNFKYMGDVCFSVYFDFKATTGDTVFFDPKMYVMSYYLIFTFNKSLNMDHFKPEHIPFFDRATLRQLKDTASDVLSREKSTSSAELFSIELKFTIDTLKSWHTRIMKPKFFELDSYDKKEWRKKNP